MKMGIERCLKAAFGGQLVEVLQVRASWEEVVFGNRGHLQVHLRSLSVCQFVTGWPLV